MKIKSVITRKPITKSDHKRDIWLSRLASIIQVLKKSDTMLDATKLQFEMLLCEVIN